MSTVYAEPRSNTAWLSSHLRTLSLRYIQDWDPLSLLEEALLHGTMVGGVIERQVVC